MKGTSFELTLKVIELSNGFNFNFKALNF